jgi:hypothetical protein
MYRDTRAPKRTVVRARGAAAGTLLLIAACGGESGPTPSPPPSPAATRDGRWLQDIDYLATELPRLHLNLFFRTPRAEFERAAEELRRAVPASSDHQIVVGLMRLAALPGDAHTTLGAWPRFRSLPLRLTRLADGLYVTAADEARAPLLGARVVAIGELAADELEARAAPLVSHENDAWLRYQVPRLLVIPEVLHALGAVGDPARALVWADDATGARLRVEAPAVLGQAALVDLTTASGAPLPLHRQRQGENYWFTVIDASRTLYLQYNRCQHGSERFDAFAERVFRLLDQDAVSRLVVDVRHNGGGNSEVDDPLIRGLQARSAWRAPGRLFCLIGEGTFSSAVWTADDLRKLGAVLVGSPTGGKPNSYGDTRSFTLPNAGVPVSYSTKQFRLVEGEDPPSLAPSLAVEPTVADLRAGRDPVLEAAVAYAAR